MIKTNNNDLILEVSQYVINLFDSNLPAWAVYHNLDHTKETVDMAVDIGSFYKLEAGEIQMLATAAWFHDTGYIDGPDNHEYQSIEIARKFLISKNLSFEDITTINKCILATKVTNKPEDLLECIMRDSDLISLGKEDYLITNNKLKNEFELRENSKIPDIDWLIRSEKFLRDHKYYTDYVKERFNKQLKTNLCELRNKIDFEKAKKMF